MSSELNSVRVRFAPSPTGELHVGSARTALYDFLFAKKAAGQMILRVEDTDQKRYVAGSMERFMEDLKWLGIEIDEGPEQGGPYAPYIQSERGDYYKDVVQMLIQKDAAYECFCSAERLEEVRNAQQAKGEQPRYDRLCRDLAPEEVQHKHESGQPFVVRLKVPLSGTITLNDLVRGEVTFDFSTIDDQVLVKSNGIPTYHLAATADDHAMEISHVFRGEEWLPSAPKHLLIFQALGWDAPKYAHLPLMLAADRKKLSKRIHGESVWVDTYRKRGYLPVAFVNFLSLVGWNPGDEREFFTLSELANEFSIERVHKAGGIFDTAKLDSFQRHYVQAMPVEELATSLGSYLTENNLEQPENFEKIVSVIQSRLGAFDEFTTLVEPFTKFDEAYDAGMLVFKKSTLESTIKGLSATYNYLSHLDSNGWNNSAILSQTLADAVRDFSLTNSDVFWPVRVALTGRQQSPSPAECLWVLGSTESLRRLELAQDKLVKGNK